MVLARGVILESVRRKDLWVVAILGFLILAASSALGFFGVDGLQVFIKDLAATVLGLFATILAVLISCRLLPEEVRNRTLYPLLARPVTRFDLLMGKLLGAVFATWIGFLLLAALTGLALVMFRVGFEPIMLQYLFAKLLGLAVLCTVGLALSTLMTPSAAATLTFVLAFGGPMFSRALIMAASGNPSMSWLYSGINALLPQLHLFDFSGRAVYFEWSHVPMWVLGALVVYALLYGGAMMAVAWLKFRRQAV
jgi:Cu-processing system permease protein